jgi:hypothetical protein
MISRRPQTLFLFVVLLLLAVYAPLLLVDARGLKGDAATSYEVEEQQEQRELIASVIGPISTIVTLLTTVVTLIQLSNTILCLFGGLGIVKCSA